MSESFEPANRLARNAGEDHQKTQVEQTEELKNAGNAEFSAGNFDAAIVYYTEALSTCPESEKGLLSVVHQNRAAAYSKLGDNENCAADCSKALALVPTYKKALSRRAKALAESGNLKLALEDITAVNMLDEFQNQADLMLANTILIRLTRQNIHEYIENNAFNLPTKAYIENQMKLFIDDPFNDEFSLSLIKSDINSGLELALKCLKDKKYEGVENACKEELIKTNNSVIRKSLALNLLATFVIMRGHHETGSDYLSFVIETKGIPNKLVINSLIKRASVYRHMEQKDKYFEDLKLAETIDPNSFEVFRHRAQYYLLELNYEKAAEEFEKAIKLNPNVVLSNLHYCYAQYRHAKQTSNESDADRYLKQLEEFVIKYPDNAESNLLYAQFFLEKEMYEEADCFFEKACEIKPENTTFLTHRAMAALLWKNSKTEALEFLERALQIDPNCVDANQSLGKLYIQMGKLKEAIGCLEKAMHLSRSTNDLVHIFLSRDTAQAQLSVIERLGIKPIISD